MKVKMFAERMNFDTQLGLAYRIWKTENASHDYGHAVRFDDGDPNAIIAGLRWLADDLEKKVAELEKQTLKKLIGEY